jgi:hypothetical protein
MMLGEALSLVAYSPVLFHIPADPLLTPHARSH